MIVLAQVWELHLEGCQSLKEKRAVLQSLQARLTERLNLAVSEVGQQDKGQRAEIAAATVACERRVAQETLRAADRIVEATGGVRIMDTAVVAR
jgi:uncharacterized protein YlxP (DUF503 family)